MNSNKELLPFSSELGDWNAWFKALGKMQEDQQQSREQEPFLPQFEDLADSVPFQAREEILLTIPRVQLSIWDELEKTPFMPKCWTKPFHSLSRINPMLPQIVTGRDKLKK